MINPMRSLDGRGGARFWRRSPWSCSSTLLTIKLSVAALVIAINLSIYQAILCAAAGSARRGIRFRHSDGFCRTQLTMCCGVAWLMLLANIFWAIAYDTEYAMVDREDDRKIGIRTSALTFGSYDVAAVMVCHALFLVLMGWAACLFQVRYLLLRWPRRGRRPGRNASTGMIRGREPACCFRAFLHNNWIGAADLRRHLCQFLFPETYLTASRRICAESTSPGIGHHGSRFEESRGTRSPAAARESVWPARVPSSKRARGSQ